MKVFLVGGAVRDQLLGLPVAERDWVVVGATPQQLLEQGFQPVGRDFPVFLHPETHEEYALARTERKTAPGYRGFVVHAEPDVTLEQDLLRRDLTINAMAQDEQGQLIDPCGGHQDLEQRLLRHVSEAFVEDPVRILRLARFAARFAHLGFRVAPETHQLMQQMVADGEVDALVPERVWQELRKALDSRSPDQFISTLRECGALARLLPEVDQLFGVPQVPEYHPEVDCGEHLLMCLRLCGAQQHRKELPAEARREVDAQTGFAVLLHDLGKGVTPREKWPAHHGHEQAGLPLVDAVCKRLRVPNAHAQLAQRVCEWHLHAHRALQLRASTLQRVLLACGAVRDREAFERFVQACRIDRQGRGGPWRDYPQARYLLSAARRLAAVRLSAAQREGLAGAAIGERLAELQVQALAAHKKAWERGDQPVP